MKYLSCIKDLQDKSIVAYHVSSENDMKLVMETLTNAIPFVHPGTILHSDQGAQYCSRVYQEFLNRHGLIGSMSRKGMPYDNAPMESFFSLLKNEELKLHGSLLMSQMDTIIHAFIHYYNFERPQMDLQKLAPAEYRSQFL